MRITLSILLSVLLLIPLNSFAAADASAVPAFLRQFANKFYVITLTASYTKQSNAALKKAFPNLVIYDTRVNVAGAQLEFRRLGFFATREEAEAILPTVHRWYPDAWVTQATPIEKVSATGVDLEALPPTTAPSTPPEKTSAGYALYLSVAANPRFALPVLPAALRRYRFYVRRVAKAGRTKYDLSFGIFNDRESAESARNELLARYPQATVREVGARERSQVAALPIQSAPAITAKVPATAIDDITGRAAALLDRARDQINARHYDAAVKTLNDVLILPKNVHTGEAIAYMAAAYDRAGQIQQAILYYQIYLRVYSGGPETQRVDRRLKTLLATLPPAVPAASATAALYTPHVVGMLSQFYTRGATRSVINAPTAGAQPLLTTTTQTSASTNLNLTTNYQTERFDNYFILRDTNTYNHMPNQIYGGYPSYDDYDYLSAAYYESKTKQSGHIVRLGRQPGSTWGTIGRYDGAQFVYSLTPSWRLALTGGSPNEYQVGASRTFYGAAVDAGPVANHWFGNLYYVRQDVDGLIDRQAVGSELRYADPLHSAYSLFDYDTSYRTLNVGTLQITWRTAGALTYNLLADHRLFPNLQTTNAIFGNMTYDMSFSRLEETGMSLADIRKLALDRTVTSNNYDAGINWQVSSKWQLGSDLRMYNTGAVPAINITPAIPGTGNIYVYSLQARKAGLFSPNDISQIGVSHKVGPTVEGNALSISNTVLLGQTWTVDSRLNLSKERTWSSYTDFTTGNPINTSTDTLLVSPSLHLSYHFKNSLSLEAEYGYQRSVFTTDYYNTTTGVHAYSEPRTSLRYYTVGYRLNF